MERTKVLSNSQVNASASAPKRDTYLRALVTLIFVVVLLDYLSRFGHLVSQAGVSPLDLSNSAIPARRSSSATAPRKLPLSSNSSSSSTGAAPAGLTFVTLIYADWTNRRSFEQNIAHNCRVIRDAPGNHKLVVHTDLPFEPYCGVCACVRFRRRRCRCPGGGCSDMNSFCEKVHFLVGRLRAQREFVFLDRDFIVLNESFVTRLATRARAHDMLISYDHTHYKNWNWRKQINSGLFFIRRLRHINYGSLLRDYYEIADNDDQPAVGRLMFDKYANYDILSFQFHCRFITDIIKFPPNLCLGLHDRGGEAGIFKRIGYEMKMLNGTRYRKYLGNGGLNVLPYKPPPLPQR